MASFAFESARQFEVDPISGQIFYREPMESFFPPCGTPSLEPSHLPGPITQGAARPSIDEPTHLPAPTRVQGRRDYRAAQRSSRTHDPIRGQGARSNEGGRGPGRTRGAVNYRPREIEILLDYAKGELPIGAKGWNVVGARFREWAAMSGCPPRTDRSLEVKFKQV